MLKFVAQLKQLVCADFVKTNLIKEAQQPLLAFGEVSGLLKAIPHLHRAADELVTTRPLHAIDAQIGAADTDGIFRRPGAGGVVFGRHQPMTWIERRRDRRTQIHVAQTHHQITCVEHDALDVSDTVKPVDAPDELDIAWAPWRIRAYRLHVFVDGQPRGRIVPA